MAARYMHLFISIDVITLIFPALSDGQDTQRALAGQHASETEVCVLGVCVWAKPEPSRPSRPLRKDFCVCCVYVSAEGSVSVHANHEGKVVCMACVSGLNMSPHADHRRTFFACVACMRLGETFSLPLR